MKYTKNTLLEKLDNVGLLKAVFVVIAGTELFHFVNSFKLNLIMPTVANILNEQKVRGWQFGNGTLCVRYGNFLWDSLSVLVFMTLLFGLWKLVMKLTKGRRA